MVGREQIAALARECGFQDIAEDLAALALPSLRLEYLDGEPSVGASRLGGLPDLPADVEWPHAKWPGYEHEPMTFFGQIALPELDPAVWPGPRSGLLSFFCRQAPDYYAVDSGGAAAVIHVPEDVALERRTAPPALEEEFRLGEAAVAPRPAMTLPTISVHPANVLVPFGFDWHGPRADQEDAYFDLVHRLALVQGFPGEAEHQMLGWPRHIQGDVMPEIVLMHFEDNRVEYESEELDRRSPDWRLLLQLAADRRLEAGFGDGGRIYFGLPAEDLDAGNFDRVQAISQSG